jgi:hypothetical protein
MVSHDRFTIYRATENDKSFTTGDRNVHLDISPWYILYILRIVLLSNPFDFFISLFNIIGGGLIVARMYFKDSIVFSIKIPKTLSKKIILL